MRTQSIAGALSLILGAGILAAACGPAATAGPGGTTTALVTQPPVTQAPAPTDGGVPSFVVPSFHSDVDLEALMPDEVGGEPVTTLSMTGDEFLDGGAAPELLAALAALGKQPSDMSVAFGGTSAVTIIAFQVGGVPAGATLNALLAAYQRSDTTVSDVGYGGKSIKKFVAPDETSYVYTARDVVFVVGGEDIADAILNEIFSKLP